MPDLDQGRPESVEVAVAGLHQGRAAVVERAVRHLDLALLFEVQVLVPGLHEG